MRMRWRKLILVPMLIGGFTDSSFADTTLSTTQVHSQPQQETVRQAVDMVADFFTRPQFAPIAANWQRVVLYDEAPVDISQPDGRARLAAHLALPPPVEMPPMDRELRILLLVTPLHATAINGQCAQERTRIMLRPVEGQGPDQKVAVQFAFPEEEFYTASTATPIAVTATPEQHKRTEVDCRAVDPAKIVMDEASTPAEALRMRWLMNAASRKLAEGKDITLDCGAIAGDCHALMAQALLRPAHLGYCPEGKTSCYLLIDANARQLIILLAPGESPSVSGLVLKSVPAPPVTMSR
jgi:hypothetical protein